jgi:hypothetical protein
MNAKVVVLGLALVGACMDVEDGSVTPIAAGPRCPEWGCGTNSGTIGDGLIFDELDSSGVSPNRGGIKLVSAYAADGTPVRVRVVRHELQAVAVSGSRVFLRQDLVHLVMKVADASTTYEVRVEAVKEQHIQFWAGAPEWVPFYELKTRKTGESQFVQYVCKHDVIDADPRWTGVTNAALVFQWDRYDAKRKLVRETTSSDPWFNLSCAATAPAKMHLLRHTRAGAFNVYGATAFPTTVSQRQAMLKMLTADYCGTGRSFTRDGQPLIYGDATGYYPFSLTDPAITTRESIWNAKGAICLDTPRLEQRYDIDAECGYALPACGPYLSSWQSYGHAISANRNPY